MINEYILESKYFKEVDESIIDSIVRLGSYSKELVYSSHSWSRSLRNYLILTHAPENITVEKEITDESLLLNRYYWLKKFYHEYSKSLGIDVGIEQQIVSILETIGNNFANFDWNKIQEIDETIEGS
jgi:hypothetical protein